MGLKSGDENLVPLCTTHHHELHNRFGNEPRFFEAKCNDPFAGQMKARLLWYTSPAYKVIK